MQGSVAKYVLSLALTLAAPALLAQSGTPEALLRAVADAVIVEVKLEQEPQAAKLRRVEALVESRITPLFDFGRMAQLAVARNWPLATAEQQSLITQEFRTLLVRNYAQALARYGGEPVVFKQLRTATPHANVTVRSELKQPGKERMTLDYEMEQTPAGWKIYNVKLADVCMISTYRDLFSEKVREGGVDGLINFLVQQNQGGGSRFKSIEAAFWEKSRLVYAILKKVIRSGLQ